MAASKTLTAEQRSERARKAAHARNSIECYVNQIVDRAPELTAEQAQKLRSILVPAGA